jgi:hypothetical protein
LGQLNKNLGDSVSYDTQLTGCFGYSDLIFAGHPADEERAFEWLTSLRKRNISYKEALGQIKSFLQSKGANTGHIMTQEKAASEFLKPWLLD